MNRALYPLPRGANWNLSRRISPLLFPSNDSGSPYIHTQLLASSHPQTPKRETTEGTLALTASLTCHICVTKLHPFYLLSTSSALPLSSPSVSYLDMSSYLVPRPHFPFFILCLTPSSHAPESHLWHQPCTGYSPSSPVGHSLANPPGLLSLPLCLIMS